MWLIWGWKHVFVIFVPFHWFEPKNCSFILILSVFHFSNLLRKNYIMSYSKHLFGIVNNLDPKEKFPVNFSKNVLFHWFDQKYLFPSNQNIPHDLPLFKLLRKITSLVILSSLWDITFLTQKKSFQWISGKMLKNTRKAFCMWLILRRKTHFLVIFFQFHGFDQKYLIPSNQNNPRDMPLFKLLRKITFWVILSYCWEK